MLQVKARQSPKTQQNRHSSTDALYLPSCILFEIFSTSISQDYFNADMSCPFSDYYSKSKYIKTLKFSCQKSSNELESKSLPL